MNVQNMEIDRSFKSRVVTTLKLNTKYHNSSIKIKKSRLLLQERNQNLDTYTVSDYYIHKTYPLKIQQKVSSVSRSKIYAQNISNIFEWEFELF